MKHAVTRALFAYWDALRKERSAPERAEIDPSAIRGVLADTFIIEVDDDRRCPFRLAGTRVSALVGKELKGASFTGLWTEDGDAMVDIVANEVAPLVASAMGETREGGLLDLELLLLPLRHRGKTHARMLGSLSPLSAPPRLGLDPVTQCEVRSRRVIRSSDRIELGEIVPPPRERLPFGRPERRGHLFVFRGGRSEDQPEALKGH